MLDGLTALPSLPAAANFDRPAGLPGEVAPAGGGFAAQLARSSQALAGGAPQTPSAPNANAAPVPTTASTDATVAPGGTPGGNSAAPRLPGRAGTTGPRASVEPGEPTLPAAPSVPTDDLSPVAAGTDPVADPALMTGLAGQRPLVNDAARDPAAGAAVDPAAAGTTTAPAQETPARPAPAPDAASLAAWVAAWTPPPATPPTVASTTNTTASTDPTALDPLAPPLARATPGSTAASRPTPALTPATTSTANFPTAPDRVEAITAALAPVAVDEAASSDAGPAETGPLQSTPATTADGPAAVPADTPALTLAAPTPPLPRPAATAPEASPQRADRRTRADALPAGTVTGNAVAAAADTQADARAARSLTAPPVLPAAADLPASPDSTAAAQAGTTERGADSFSHWLDNVVQASPQATANPANPVSGARGEAPGVSIATPATAPEFREALGVQVSVLARDGVQQAELHLNPTDMGPISVRIEIDGTQAQVSFGVDHAGTRAIVEAGLPELASALREAGLTLTGGGVSDHARGPGSDADAGGSRQGAAPQDRPDGRRGGTAGDDDPPAPAVPLARRVRLPGSVDLYA